MHAPGLNWRGATSAPLSGYMLIGRGADFATTLTSASADDIDEFAETLCGGSKTKYMYKGKCKAMQLFNAGTVTTGDKKTFAVTFWTTVNGPVIGYATSGGKKVAITSKRASYGKDVLDLLFNRRLSDGQVHSPQSFIKAAALTPQTFNSFYVDSKHVAEITTGSAAVAGPRTPTRACRRSATVSTSGAGTSRPRAIHKGSTRRTPRSPARWSTGTTSPPTGLAPRRTRSGATARWRECRC